MTTCSVSNTIRDPSGTPVVNVPVKVELIPRGGFRIVEGTEVAPVVSTTSDPVTGVWTLALELSSNINPANSYYRVTESVQIEQGGSRVWLIVPVGASALLPNILIAQPTPGNSIPQYLTKQQADALYLPASTTFLTLPSSYLTRLYAVTGG